jgi:hypothetical protein
MTSSFFILWLLVESTANSVLEYLKELVIEVDVFKLEELYETAAHNG